MKSEEKQRPFKGKFKKRDKAIEQKHNFSGSEKPWLKRILKPVLNCHSITLTVAMKRRYFWWQNKFALHYRITKSSDTKKVRRKRRKANQRRTNFSRKPIDEGKYFDPPKLPKEWKALHLLRLERLNLCQLRSHNSWKEGYKISTNITMKWNNIILAQSSFNTQHAGNERLYNCCVVVNLKNIAAQLEISKLPFHCRHSQISHHSNS